MIGCSLKMSLSKELVQFEHQFIEVVLIRNPKGWSIPILFVGSLDLGFLSGVKNNVTSQN